ncbi:MAG: hypothetical protein ACOX87_02245 [Chloroflexota bacterium]|jgi:hypothetical protein
MAREEIREQVISWRRSEDNLYRAVVQAPELYTNCIRLVRAVANSLSDLNDSDALMEAYHQTDSETVASIADAMDLERRAFLDYDLILDAAFYIRYQEIADMKSCADIQERVNRARSEGAEWVLLYDNKIRSRGHSYFERLEMQLSDGFGLRTSSELDWEKGLVFTVEPVNLDPCTGLLKRGVPPPEPPQQYLTEKEMAAAVEKLRSKYSNSNGSE